PASETLVRFTLRPSGTTTTGGTGSGHFDAEGAGVVEPAAPLDEHAVSSPARLLVSTPAFYPPQARAAEIEVDVPVAVVVDEHGQVTQSRAVKPSGYGLDEAAVRSVRSYRFSPALKDGRPVRVRMRWTVQFRLR